jgi:hypothetical protein
MIASYSILPLEHVVARSAIRTLPVAEPTPEEIAVIRAGWAEHARGETLTHADIVHDLEDRVRKEGTIRRRRRAHR